MPQLVRLPGREIPLVEEAEGGEEEEAPEADGEEGGAGADALGPDPGERLLVAWRDDRVRTAVVRLDPGASPRASR